MHITTNDLTRYGFNPDGTPKYLYHYTKVESAIKILETGTLRMNSLCKMNDPWEFLHRTPAVYYSGDPTMEESMKMVQNNINAHNERNNCVRLVSLAIDNPDTLLLHKGWNLLSMWTLYGQNHEGICLVFDYNEFQAAFKNMCNQRQLQHKHGQITYVDDLDDLEDMFSQPIGSFVDDQHIDHLFTKPDNYAPEQEYRFVAINHQLTNSDTPEIMDIKSSIRGIITGYRYSSTGTLDNQLTDLIALYNNMSRFEMNSACLTDPLYSRQESREWLARIMKKYTIDDSK